MGNRKIEIKEDSILFKISKNEHFVLKLPNLRSNYFNEIKNLIILCKNKEKPVTFKVDSQFIYLSFEEDIKKETIFKSNKDVYCGIDLNPNYIGFVIKKNGRILKSKCFDLSNLNKDSSDKLNYEVLEISKLISKEMLHYGCKTLFLEELTMKSKDHKIGRKFNRTVNNR